MALPNSKSSHMTEEEYLTFERESEFRHEYVDGEIYAMSGASWNHNVICQSTDRHIDTQLDDADCTVLVNDMRLQILTRRSYRYPDIMVVCGEPEFVDSDVDMITNPTVIIEVLSTSTALMDRNTKLDEYIQIPSVQEYLLIAQDEPKIERYLRQDSGDWLYTQVSGIDKELTLPSINCKLELSFIYRKAKFEE